MRLFVALDLPASIRNDLAQCTPSAERGIRPIPPDRMHLTVHYIGDADVDEVCQALGRVNCKPCAVSVNAAGRFRLSGGGTILWAGVEPTEELLELRSACGQALAAIGIKLERRSWVPHVTLARLKPYADKSVVKDFLSAGDYRELGAFIAEEFVLYNSVNGKDGPRYEVVDSFPMNH